MYRGHTRKYLNKDNQRSRIVFSEIMNKEGDGDIPAKSSRDDGGGEEEGPEEFADTED